MLNVEVSKFGEILNERPKGMSYETYRIKRKEQNLKLHGYNVKTEMGKVHVTGRLEGVCVPSEKWTNSKDVRLVIK